LIPVGAALALLANLNLRYFSSRLKARFPGLPRTVLWFFVLVAMGVFLLNLSHIWFITPMRVVSFFLVVDSVSCLECRHLSAFPQAVGSILTEETRAAWSEWRDGPGKLL
jgi:fatty acid desaturase